MSTRCRWCNEVFEEEDAHQIVSFKIKDGEKSFVHFHYRCWVGDEYFEGARLSHWNIDWGYEMDLEDERIRRSIKK